jgi:hypothetical protein
VSESNDLWLFKGFLVIAPRSHDGLETRFAGGYLRRDAGRESRSLTSAADSPPLVFHAVRDWPINRKKLRFEPSETVSGSALVTASRGALRAVRISTHDRTRDAQFSLQSA